MSSFIIISGSGFKISDSLIHSLFTKYPSSSFSSASSFTGLFNFENADPMEKVNTIQNILVGLGYRQCINNTFQSENVASFSGKTPVKVMNPLNVHMSGIRTSLLPSMKRSFPE